MCFPVFAKSVIFGSFAGQQSCRRCFIERYIYLTRCENELSRKVEKENTQHNHTITGITGCVVWEMTRNEKGQADQIRSRLQYAFVFYVRSTLALASYTWSLSGNVHSAHNLGSWFPRGWFQCPAENLGTSPPTGAAPPQC